MLEQRWKAQSTPVLFRKGIMPDGKTAQKRRRFQKQAPFLSLTVCLRQVLQALKQT